MGGRHARRLYRTGECGRDEIRSALMTESAKVSEIAAQHGFTFTSEEGEQAWETAQENELSDFELDMVAGRGRSKNGGS